MISDVDIYRTAEVLLAQHGNAAIQLAVERSLIFSEKGDTDSAALWRRIERAMEAVQARQFRQAD